MTDSYMILIPDSSLLPQNIHQLKVAHRFNQEIDDEAAKNGFGLDGGANIRIQVDYVPWQDNQFSVSRTSPDGTLELNWRRIWWTEKELSVQSLLGSNIPIGRDEIREHSTTSYNTGLITGWRASDEWQLSAAVFYASHSNPDAYAGATGPRADEENYSLSLALATRWWLNPMHSFELESIKSVTGYEGDNRYPVTSAAWSLHYGLHTFQLVFSNHRLLNLNQFVASRDMLDARDVFLGFSISRLL